ncbi:MAG: FIST C-terminal domain-containing protein [Magnetococcales bacterium]|nr:FIST C-terminal domain-containing protein [Magnetococcales bacterium]
MKIAQQIFHDGRLQEQPLREMATLNPQLVLVFGSAAAMAQPAMHPILRRVFADAHLMGCSTAGEIAQDKVFDGACVVTAIGFQDTTLRLATRSVMTMEESFVRGQELGRELNDPELRGIVLLCKGVEVNGSAVIQGVVGEIGHGIPVTGGLAGDGGAFHRTWVLNDDGVTDTGIVGLGLYGGAIRIGHGSKGGWESFGPARRVTRCQGNLLYELDGEPALNIYKKYLGDYAKDLPASGLLFPFEMLGSDHSRLGLIRTILGIDETTGGLVLAGDIDPEGYLRLMHASTDALVNGAEIAAQSTRQRIQGSASGLAILVSCVGRKLVMGDHVDEEVEVVREALAAGTVIAGFYSYGEIGPLAGTTECRLHNQTMTITFLTETGKG